MNQQRTIAFIDLAGSTAAFQALGNEQAADVVSKITRWIGRVCEAHNGDIIKFLGDGVLATFMKASEAVQAAIFIQQSHTHRIQTWPEPLRMHLRIGLAAGHVVELGDDSYGDVVNFAARLCEMAVGDGILVSDTVADQLAGLRTDKPVRSRSLGILNIRGMKEPRSVFQIEWNDEVETDLLTVQGGYQSESENDAQVTRMSSIALSRLGAASTFLVQDLPIVLGRIPDCAFVINDQRVSRQHAKLEYVNGSFVLTDTSSYGTWVRFEETAGSEFALRRSGCTLHSKGEIALGAPFSDPSAPIITYRIYDDVATREQTTMLPSLFDIPG
ncbi:MAG: adenylate/guanylate cyclase domain-containing protein [Comamonadaceae bacterium]|nr:adenylate/guanylate cyclase domain-containing protein [Comamonadaceae bacterium]